MVPEPTQPQAPNLSTAALGTIISARAAQRRSVGVDTENVPPTPASPKPLFHDDDIESVLRRPLLSIRQSRVQSGPTVPLSQLYSRLYFGCLPLLGIARLPLSRQNSTRQERVGVNRSPLGFPSLRRFRFQLPCSYVTAGPTTSCHRATFSTVTDSLTSRREARPSHRLGLMHVR